MKEEMAEATPQASHHSRQALVAIDLGAESCRVSLLRWHGDRPEIKLAHRIPNGPELCDGQLRWPIERILQGVRDGLIKAAQLAPEGIASIAVDGWAVDYVRLQPDGTPLHPPFCYRDERTVESKATADGLISPEELFKLTGAQPLRINTVYQLLADQRAGIDSKMPWLNLPEYVLYSLGGRAVAEYTNATHTGLVDIETGNWSRTVFDQLGLSVEAAAPIVPAGSDLGKLSGALGELPAFRNTRLIAPACHDTASAIAAVTADLSHTAYVVSGTWSLVGTVIDQPITTGAANKAGFTNQGEAAGGFCFHTNINGMWLLKQSIDHWCALGREPASIALTELVEQAELVGEIPGLIDVDAAPLMLAGDMPDRINHELKLRGLATIPDQPGTERIFARVIFESLAMRYATVLASLARHTDREFQQIVILGGGSRNTLLRRLTEASTGLPVIAGEAEGSTLGNFAVQLAAFDSGSGKALSSDSIRFWASRLARC